MGQVLLRAGREEKVGEANWCCKHALKGNVFLRQEIVYKLHGSTIYIKQSPRSLPSISTYSLTQGPAGPRKPLFAGFCGFRFLQRGDLEECLLLSFTRSPSDAPVTDTIYQRLIWAGLFGDGSLINILDNLVR